MLTQNRYTPNVMVDISPYWTMKVLQAGGHLKVIDFPEVKRWFTDRFVDVLNTETLSESDCQRSLWTIWQTNTEEGQWAELSLRCWLSHLIAAVCTQLAGRFGQRYGFTTTDLLPLVLDDDGTTVTSTVASPDSTSPYTFYSLTILKRYQPGKGSLGAWATRLIKNAPEINRFFMEQELYLITPWAILNDTKVDQLSRFLPHLSQGELKAAEQLLKTYHRVYRGDRLKKRFKSGIKKPTPSAKQRCTNPTDEQLQRINSQEAPNVVFQQLYDLADQLREARIARRLGTIPKAWIVRTGDNVSQHIDNLPAPESALEDDDDDNAPEQFMDRYRENFRATLDQSIAHVVQGHIDRHQKRKPLKGQLYRDALELFHCQGYSMGAIAQHLKMTNQVAVTRLLKLRQLRREVGIHWLQRIKQTVLDDLVHQLSADHLNRISDQLEQVLQEEIAGVEQEAAAEAQIPKNRTTNSLFARRLCAVLPTLKV